VLAIAAIGGLAFAVIEGSHWGWTSPPILSIAALALAAGAAFFLVEARLEGAMVPLDLFRNRVFSSALSIAGLMTFGMYALLFLGSRLIKSTIQERRSGRQRPDSFVRVCRSGLRCA
jgi:DHA2 family methylenomycin A resistance protein-like MFS transporter